MRELLVEEISSVAGGNAATAGEAIGGTLVGIGLAIAPETLGGGLVLAAVGGLILGASIAADAHGK